MAVPDAPLDVGLALPHIDDGSPRTGPLRWETVATWARRAEAAGLTSVWLSDAPSSADHLIGQRVFDPLVGMAALGRDTRTVRLGTLSLSGSLRPPGLLAKAAATIDVLSGGRVTLGLGMSSPSSETHPEQLAGQPFTPQQLSPEQLSEALQVLRGAFSGGPFSFDGRHYQVDRLRCLPRPVQRPSPPLWVSGTDQRALALVVRHADGWNPGDWGTTSEEYRQLSARLERACEEVGRDPATIVRSANLRALVGEGESDLRRRWQRLCERTPSPRMPAPSLHEYRQGGLVGTVAQVREQVETWAGSGVATLILSMGALPFVDTGVDALELDDLELAASAVT